MEIEADVFMFNFSFFSRYAFLFMQQEIMDSTSTVLGTFPDSSGNDLRTVYSENVYTIESDIRGYYSFSFPGKLDSYQTLFRNAQTTDLCVLSTNVTSSSTC